MAAQAASKAGFQTPGSWAAQAAASAGSGTGLTAHAAGGAVMLAAAQGGTHETGRQTFGHSIIIDPWGRVVAEAGIDPGIVVADIDLAEVGRVRGRIPSLRHDRAFEQPAASALRGAAE